MITTLPPYSNMMEGRVRLSCGSVDRQTAQSQPSVGTPMEVPLPSTVRVAFILLLSPSDDSRRGALAGLRRARQRVGDFDIGHAQFVEAVLQEVFFRGGEVAFAFFGDHAQ